MGLKLIYLTTTTKPEVSQKPTDEVFLLQPFFYLDHDFRFCCLYQLLCR